MGPNQFKPVISYHSAAVLALPAFALNFATFHVSLAFT